MKDVEYVKTIGIEQLQLPPATISWMFVFAKGIHTLKEDATFFVFRPDGSITNGDGELLETFQPRVPEPVWVIFDDHGDHDVATMLLPEEY